MNRHSPRVNIGKSKVDELLNMKKISQRTFSHLCNFNVNTVSQANKTGICSINMVYELAEICNLIPEVIPEVPKDFNVFGANSIIKDFTDNKLTDNLTTSMREGSFNDVFARAEMMRQTKTRYSSEITIDGDKNKLLKSKSEILKVSEFFKSNYKQKGQIKPTQNLEEQFSQINSQDNHEEDFKKLENEGINIYFTIVPNFILDVKPVFPESKSLKPITESQKQITRKTSADPKLKETIPINVKFKCEKQLFIVFSTESNANFSARFSIGDVPNPYKLEELEKSRLKFIIKGMWNSNVEQLDLHKNPITRKMLGRYELLISYHDKINKIDLEGKPSSLLRRNVSIETEIAQCEIRLSELLKPLDFKSVKEKKNDKI